VVKWATAPVGQWLGNAEPSEINGTQLVSQGNRPWFPVILGAGKRNPLQKREGGN